MRVFFYGCITMDGYLADGKHRLDWLYATGTPEETDCESFYRRMDITLMGKRTYAEIAKAANAEDAYPTTENYVFTHAREPLLRGFLPVHGDVAAFVKQLPPDKNIWVVGGNTILAPLIDGDLVDCLILQIAPVLLGKGIPLFTQKEAVKRFSLKEVKRYGPFAELVYVK